MHRECKKLEQDTDFETQVSVYNVANVESAELCQQKCTEEHRCGAWTWGKMRNAVGLTDVCFMKALEPWERPERADKRGVVSGLPCRLDVWRALWITTTPPPLPSHYPPGSLYCFALMQPEGYERDLIKMQHEKRVSIFACDEHVVFSSKVLQLAEGLTTHVVDSNLRCNYGGEFKTALNTEIFFAVWKEVMSENRFRLHDWTVKVDPDCVFFPDRLKPLVQPYSSYDDNGKGLYLNNCRMGLHGPIEVFSRAAVKSWWSGRDACIRYFRQLCSGDCLWGEDMFIDQCLWKVLGVHRLSSYSLLVEDHCDPPLGWESCADQSTVAFHPFKSKAGYSLCLEGSAATQERYA